ncbi:hypothetical protein [Salinarimonas sp.]|uniref:hypothetical protein n=1 Tax=Salinarimonas sp. TaxID=2766526 RepID=UPI003918F700
MVIERLDERHVGLTPARAQAYYEAATVCLGRHHQPPSDAQVNSDDVASEFTILWTAPDDRTIAANANETDATCDGAYAVCLAAVENEKGLVAFTRAKNKSGADYYLVPAGADFDLETAIRLEVSGVDRGDVATIQRRLDVKKKQAENGESDTPAIAAVFGFRELLVLIGTIPR